MSERLKLYLVLSIIFFLISMSMGYATLNRFDPGTVVGLSDYQLYAAIVEDGWNNADARGSAIGARVLVPYLAHLVYETVPAIGSWNMVAFSMLLLSSIFTSLSAVLIFVLSNKFVAKPSTALFASFLFITNFFVINSYLVGSVDSAYGLFFLLLIYAMHMNKWGMVPIIGVLGCLTKEAFLPIAGGLVLGWITYAFSQNHRIDMKSAISFVLMIFLGGITIITTTSEATGTIQLPWNTLLEISERNAGKNFSITFEITDVVRVIFTLGLLVALAIPSLKIFSRQMLAANMAAVIILVVLGFIVGVAALDIARYTFSLAALLLCCAAAATLQTLLLPPDTDGHEHP